MYKMYSEPDFTPEIFHAYVTETLALWEQCLTWNTERGCAYNDSLIPWEYPDRVCVPGVVSKTSYICGDHILWRLIQNARFKWWPWAVTRFEFRLLG